MDLAILNFIQNNLQSDLMNNIFEVFTHLGDKAIIWLIIAFLLLLNNKYRKLAILTILAIILTTILGEFILKNIIRRPRPFVEYSHLKSIIAYTKGFSFPSGHTGSSFAAATVLASEFKKYRPYFYTLALLISISRLMLFVHYPSDILGGMLLGIMCAMIILKLSNKEDL